MTANHLFLAIQRRPYADAYPTCRAVVLRPESRGRVELISATIQKKPAAYPARISLATDNDGKTLRAGGAWSGTSGRQLPLRPFATHGDRARRPSRLRRRTRRLHPCDQHYGPPSARDLQNGHRHRPHGRGRSGIAGVRHGRTSRRRWLGDAGREVGAHINAPIIMIAEKAADLIRGRQPLGSRPGRLGAAELSRQ